MARQQGVIMLTGPIGNLSFYKMNGQYFARKKSGVSGDRIKSSPAYARTRENIAEFGQASRSAKLFRQTFPALISTMADCRVTGRLTAAMLRVVKSDDVNSRGKRCVSDGKTALLKGFEFNKHCKLDQRLKVQYHASIDRTTGTMSIEIPAFVPSNEISAPAGATHFRLKAAGAAINFNKAEYSTAICESAEIEVTTSEYEPLKLTMTVTASPHPMFLVLGIEFLQRINGISLPLSGQSNAMAIVNVDDNSLFRTVILSCGKGFAHWAKGEGPRRAQATVLLRQHVYNSASKFSPPLRQRDPRPFRTPAFDMPAPVLWPRAQDKPPEKDVPTRHSSLDSALKGCDTTTYREIWLHPPGNSAGRDSRDVDIRRHSPEPQS